MRLPHFGAIRAKNWLNPSYDHSTPAKDMITGKMPEKITAEMEAEMLEKVDPKTAQNSDKRANFVRLAENRTRNAIRAIRVIGKLSNKKAYQYDETDVGKIVRALNKEVDALRARMSHTTNRDTVDFSL
jgi:hypothetical protein